MDDADNDETYFHMSASALPNGTKLESRGFPFVEQEVEDILSDAMPKNGLSRQISVFVTLSKDACKNGLKYDEGYLHSVRPIGPVHRRDLKWLRQLELRHRLRTRNYSPIERAMVSALLNKGGHVTLTDDEIARRYWAGDASDDPDWEFVVASAEVTACLSDKPIRFRGVGSPDDASS